LVYAILNIAGADHHQDGFYSTESLLALGRPALKICIPVTVPGGANGKLKESSHAFLESVGPNAGLQCPQDVIIFVIGGTTCEARTVALLNQEPTSGSTGGARLLLGGTCVHNSA
ncbi:hypothetical protein BJV78DRAFT_1202074, partial [Lactifluus subvellereus]